MSGLILRGNLKLGTTSGTAVEVGSEVIHFKLTAAVDQVEVKETMGTPKSARGGASDYSVTIGYLANDLAGSLFTALWDAAETATGTLYFEGSLRDDAVGVANPRWSGTLVVTEAAVGGNAEGVSESSATFPLTGAPTQATV